jgi:hypothetical protein
MGRKNVPFLHPSVFLWNTRKVLVLNGRPVGTRTPDLYRVKALIGFTTTYKTAGTAKVRGSHIRHTFCGLGCGLEMRAESAAIRCIVLNAIGADDSSAPFYVRRQAGDLGQYYLSRRHEGSKITEKAIEPKQRLGQTPPRRNRQCRRLTRAVARSWDLHLWHGEQGYSTRVRRCLLTRCRRRHRSQDRWPSREKARGAPP